MPVEKPDMDQGSPLLGHSRYLIEQVILRPVSGGNSGTVRPQTLGLPGSPNRRKVLTPTSRVHQNNILKGA
jgi:hypothetical protein